MPRKELRAPNLWKFGLARAGQAGSDAGELPKCLGNKDLEFYFAGRLSTFCRHVHAPRSGLRALGERAPKIRERSYQPRSSGAGMRSARSRPHVAPRSQLRDARRLIRFGGGRAEPRGSGIEMQRETHVMLVNLLPRAMKRGECRCGARLTLQWLRVASASGDGVG